MADPRQIHVPRAAPELQRLDDSMIALRLTVCVVLCAGVAVSAQEPAKFFDDNCSACHTIGGPPGAAPDLKDVSKRHDAAWLVRFILNPKELARTDAAAAALVKQYDDSMPPVEGVTPAFVEALLRYIDGGSAAASPAAQPERVMTAADVAAGRAWFEGRRSLERRGPACVACHQIESIGRLGGGTLGPDLTQAPRRLGGNGGVTRWLGNPPTRVMRAVFHNQPLTDEEAFAIGALLADESSRNADASGRRSPAAFAASGVAVALLGLAAMGLIWSPRLRSVRRSMVASARRGER